MIATPAGTSPQLETIQTTSDGNSSDTTNQGGEMERNYKDDGSTKDEQDWRSKKWTI
jgi:hypothetical protein